MISIIICSANAIKLHNTLESISKTIGYPYEVIVKDNRLAGDGICKVYNTCAMDANGDYLCFLHEDVVFNSENWGFELVNFINSNSNCGVVGCAGTDYISKYHAYWWRCGILEQNYRSFNSVDKKEITKIKTGRILENNPDGFSEVIVLDGFFMFCKKTVWEDTRFDEKSFDRFHFYDVDFSFSQCLKGRKNYVCHTIDVTHLSLGTCNLDHYKAAKIYREKYNYILPYTIDNSLSSLKLEMNECKSIISLWLYTIRLGVPEKEFFREIKKYMGIKFTALFIFYPIIWLYFFKKNSIISRF